MTEPINLLKRLETNDLYVGALAGLPDDSVATVKSYVEAWIVDLQRVIDGSFNVPIVEETKSGQTDD